MYFRKASEDQRPIIIIVYTGISARCIAIAAPDLSECVPTSPALKPSLASPMAKTAARNAFLMSSDVICDVLPASVSKVLIGVSPVAPFIFHARFTRAAVALTGHRIKAPVWNWVIVSILSPFFWSSKVIDTKSELWSWG